MSDCLNFTNNFIPTTFYFNDIVMNRAEWIDSADGVIFSYQPTPERVLISTGPPFYPDADGNFPSLLTYSGFTINANIIADPNIVDAARCEVDIEIVQDECVDDNGVTYPGTYEPMEELISLHQNQTQISNEDKDKILNAISISRTSDDNDNPTQDPNNDYFTVSLDLSNITNPDVDDFYVLIPFEDADPVIPDGNAIQDVEYLNFQLDQSEGTFVNIIDLPDSKILTFQQGERVDSLDLISLTSDFSSNVAVSSFELFVSSSPNQFDFILQITSDQTPILTFDTTVSLPNIFDPTDGEIFGINFTWATNSGSNDSIDGLFVDSYTYIDNGGYSFSPLLLAHKRDKSARTNLASLYVANGVDFKIEGLSSGTNRNSVKRTFTVYTRATSGFIGERTTDDIITIRYPVQFNGQDLYFRVEDSASDAGKRFILLGADGIQNPGTPVETPINPNIIFQRSYPANSFIVDIVNDIRAEVEQILPNGFFQINSDPNFGTCTAQPLKNQIKNIRAANVGFEFLVNPSNKNRSLTINFYNRPPEELSGRYVINELNRLFIEEFGDLGISQLQVNDIFNDEWLDSHVLPYYIQAARDEANVGLGGFYYSSNGSSPINLKMMSYDDFTKLSSDTGLNDNKNFTYKAYDNTRVSDTTNAWNVFDSVSDFASHLMSQMPVLKVEVNPFFMDEEIGIIVPNRFTDIIQDTFDTLYPAAYPSTSAADRFQTLYDTSWSIISGTSRPNPFNPSDIRTILDVAVIDYTQTITIDQTNLSDLVSEINSDAILSQYVFAQLTSQDIAINKIQSLDTGSFSLTTDGASVSVSGEALIPDQRQYNLADTSKYSPDRDGIIDLISELNADWTGKATFSESTSDNYINAIQESIKPENLNSVTQLFVSSPFSETSLFGKAEFPITPKIVRGYVSLRYILNRGNTDPTDPDPSDTLPDPYGPDNPTKGVQAALGGYRVDDQFFINPAPNAFFEPNYNSFFNIQFSTSAADEAYVLIRTREDEDGTDYSSSIDHYQAIVNYNNGDDPEVLTPVIPTDAPFTIWADSDWNDGNVPVLFKVPTPGPTIDLVVVNDSFDPSDSVNVRINNFVKDINDFGFLAINQSNLSGSMENSRQGNVFGLVLDNKGVWDVLIGPGAEIERVLDGEFPYSTFEFDHNPIVADEAFDYSLFESDNLPQEVLDSIDIIPVPGFPKVGVLRIGPGVKQYLASQRGDAPTTDISRCSVDIDVEVFGRSSGAQGVARVSIFYDYTCVFDINLCDFFWNLSNPNAPEPPDALTNTISVDIEQYIDCSRLNVVNQGDNSEISLPLLLTLSDVPMFENGNSLLLVKGVYNDVISNYYFPSYDNFEFVQNSNCESINTNAPLANRLNRRIVFLPGQSEPITDLAAVENAIDNENSYLYIKPLFQFPEIDLNNECGPNEIVIAGIGYQFKNWTPGFRQDNLLIGVDLILANTLLNSPSLDLCCKFYYKREDS